MVDGKCILVENSDEKVFYFCFYINGKSFFFLRFFFFIVNDWVKYNLLDSFFIV